MENNNNNCVRDVRPSCPSVCPSIFGELKRVKEQVNFANLGRYVKGRDGEFAKDEKGEYVVTFDPIYGEVCLIIAEVNILNPKSAIKVAGSVMPVSIVQEVYRELTYEHIQTVVFNFTRMACEVFNKKAYLRTSLYNAVFEETITTANQLAQDGYQYKV